MSSIEARAEVAVALVFQTEALHGHLRDALRDLGANVVYETEATRFDRPALDRAGAQVVIVNLDPDNDAPLESIDDLLVDDKLKVVFNDGEVTSKLSGYDLARWARHLAAKIVGDVDLLPPRPAGAEAVPVRSMPQHALTTANKPKSMNAPVVSDESMREATDAIANALASFDMQATKVEAKNASAAIPATPPVAAAASVPVANNDLDALLGDFGRASVTAAASAPAENPFADLGLEMDLGLPAEEAITLESPPAAATDDFVADLGFDPTPVAAQPVTMEIPVPASEAADNPFGDLDFSIPELPPQEKKPAPAQDLGSDLLAFADLNFDDPPPASEAPAGLDDFLAQHAPRVEPEPARAAPKPAAAPVAATAPAAARKSLLEGLELSLEPDNAVPAAPLPKAPEPEAPAFSFNLDSLSLEPTEDELKAMGGGDPFGDRGMTFETVLDESRPAQKITPPGTPPAPAAPAAPRQIAEPTKPQAKANFEQKPAVVEEDPFDFSFDLPEDAVSAADEFTAPEMIAPAAELNDDEAAFMREFEALTAGDLDKPQAPASGPIHRAWVLGASIGGPDAVREFLAALPPTIGATFVLAQHMGADFVDLMVGQLQKATRLPVSLATAGTSTAHGRVLVVPIAERMLLDPSGDVRVVALDEVSPYSPSIDRVLIDIADRFGDVAGAIIFSGMAHDAIEGAKHMAAKGGTIWVQDPSTCVVSSMIDGAMDAGIVSFIGTPADLAAEFMRRYGQA